MRVHHELEIVPSRRATSCSFTSISQYPRRRSHPLAGRSKRRCADGHTLTHNLCTSFCSKGKAGPENVTISKLSGALHTPHENKCRHTKGKVGPDRAPTSKLPGALPKPQKDKSPYPKGKAGPDLSNASKLPDALPWLPRDMPPYRTRSLYP